MINSFSKRVKRHIAVTAVCIISVALAAFWLILMRDVSFYFSAAAVIILSFVPFFTRFENTEHSAGEVALLASMIAFAVVSRAAFYYVPQVKPIGAAVILCAVCLGAERGYFVGVMSAFVSNFIFGQGAWTPFQMLALGTVGLISGALFYRVRERVNSIVLAAVGFLLCSAVYGVITDLSTVLMMYGRRVTLKGALAVFAAGVPTSLIFGAATAAFLLFFGKVFIRKTTRIIDKYIK